MKIVTAAQMAALEAASERHGVGTDALMENAGLVVARAARHDLGGAAGARVLVLVGPGNNGADGLVAARHLRRWGAEVTAYLVTRRPDTDPKMDLALEYGVGVLRSASDPGLAQLERLLAGSRLVIDAVLGTGRARPLEGAVRDVMLCLGACRGRGRFSTPRPQPRVLALDLPTGLDPDTGEVDPACPVADLTVALGLPKAGLLAFPGAAHAGELKVADIGLPSGLEEEERIDLELLTSELAPARQAAQLPQRHLRPCPGDRRIAELRGRGLPGLSGGGPVRRRAGNPGHAPERVSHRRRQVNRGDPPAIAG